VRVDSRNPCSCRYFGPLTENTKRNTITIAYHNTWSILRITSVAPPGQLKRILDRPKSRDKRLPMGSVDRTRSTNSNVNAAHNDSCLSCLQGLNQKVMGPSCTRRQGLSRDPLGSGVPIIFFSS